MLENQLTLHMWINQIGTKSFGFQYQLVDRSAETIVYATGESVQVLFDYGKNSSMVIPEGLRESLAEYLPGWFRQASQKKDECYAYLFLLKVREQLILDEVQTSMHLYQMRVLAKG